MRQVFATALGSALSLALTVAPAFAQAPSTKLGVADYLDLEQVGSPQISPDGKSVLYARGHVDRVNDREESEIWIVDADGQHNRFLAKGGAPVWSPDGTRIAYINAAENNGGAQIFVRWMNAEGATSQITHTEFGPKSVTWSPDGKQLSFVMFVPKHETWNIPMPQAPANAKWNAPPRVVDRLHYRADREGYVDDGFQHLFVVPADGGTPRALTSGDWSVGSTFDGLGFGAVHSWAPDGSKIFFDGFKDPDADRNFSQSHIYSIDVKTGAIAQLTKEKGVWRRPVVSPDGKTVAYVGRTYLPVPWQVADLHLVNTDGSNSRDLTRAYDRDFSEGGGLLIWAPDGSGLYAAPQDMGNENVVFVDAKTGAVKKLTSGQHLLTFSSMSKSGELAGVQTSFQKPRDVVRISVPKTGAATVTQITNVNDDLLAGKTLATAEEIWVPSTGGAKVQGWIVKPPDFDKSKKYPMLLEIHGGPQGAYGPGFDMMWQVFASSGYVVLYINPRGSTGYGDAFVRSIERSYPGPDYDDLMAATDTVVGRGYVDTQRMYVAGCSGGGVLSSWVIGHTNRFAAAAVRCPVTDWVSMAGQTDVSNFSYQFFDKPFWEDPVKWYKQSSIAYVGNVTTPTLLMTGVKDMRTPMAQTEEFYAALKMRGIPTKLLRFENEWHGTESVPSNWMRTMLYMQSWFGQYTKTGS